MHYGFSSSALCTNLKHFTPFCNEILMWAEKLEAEWTIYYCAFLPRDPRARKNHVQSVNNLPPPARDKPEATHIIRIHSCMSAFFIPPSTQHPIHTVSNISFHSTWDHNVVESPVNFVYQKTWTWTLLLQIKMDIQPPTRMVVVVLMKRQQRQRPPHRWHLPPTSMSCAKSRPGPSSSMSLA